MTDTLGSYIGTSKPKRLHKKEIEQMKKIMKTVPLISSRNELHHSKEIEEADNEFDKKLQLLDN